MLSRVQELEQLFILGSVPEDKLYPSGLALAEVERLSGIAINKQSSWYNASDGIKIACLNIQSLQAHYKDLEKDFALQQSDVIGLSETWNENREYHLPGYEGNFNNAGRGKGVAVFHKSPWIVTKSFTAPSFQFVKVSSQDIDIIIVYRSNGDNKQELVDSLKKHLELRKTTVICGDFNICNRREPQNIVLTSLKAIGFQQLIESPTYKLGGQIDHLYVFSPGLDWTKYEVILHTPYYSDHSAILFHLNKSKT